MFLLKLQVVIDFLSFNDVRPAFWYKATWRIIKVSPTAYSAYAVSVFFTPVIRKNPRV